MSTYDMWQRPCNAIPAPHARTLTDWYHVISVSSAHLVVVATHSGIKVRNCRPAWVSRHVVKPEVPTAEFTMTSLPHRPLPLRLQPGPQRRRPRNRKLATNRAGNYRVLPPLCETAPNRRHFRFVVWQRPSTDGSVELRRLLHRLTSVSAAGGWSAGE